MWIRQLLKKLTDENHHTFLWTRWGTCSSSVITERSSVIHHLRIAAYPWLWYLRPMQDFSHVFWQEMLMEHVCIVKWAHHKIVWPSQGFARRAVIFFFISLQELYLIVSVHILSWIVLDLFLLHNPWACTVWQSTLLRFWENKVKWMEESVLQ